MATTPVNNIKASIAPNSVMSNASPFIDATVSFNQGDLIALVSNKLKAIAIDGDTATLLGVATATVVSGKLKSPYATDVDASVGVSAVPGPAFGVIVEMTLNTGDAFTVGGLVYPIGTVDAQTVSSSSNTGARSACGVFVGVAVGSATAGQKGLIRLGARVGGNLLL